MGLLPPGPRRARRSSAASGDGLTSAARAPAPALLAEFLGSAGLGVVVAGSGIAAQRLSPGDPGLQLFENAIATALGLFVLISVFIPISGAHFNPLISLVDAALGRRGWRNALGYLPAQFVGCASGVMLANAMFALPVVKISGDSRATPTHLLSEVVATAGLVVVVFVLARTDRSRLAPASVAAYIGGAYFFTSSTSFANPAITIARTLTDSFSGIAPTSAAGFVAAQVIGAALGLGVVLLLTRGRENDL